VEERTALKAARRLVRFFFFGCASYVFDLWLVHFCRLVVRFIHLDKTVFYIGAF
jgi:hypothetical protein